MFGTIELPVWLFVLILLFAAATLMTHFINPPVRWFFRRRMERAVDELNKRLERPIQPFKLARRHDMIQRLIYDPVVTQAVAQHSAETGMREDVAFALARKYAREIVPSFSATIYFGFAIRLARWLSTRLYDVRVGERPGALGQIAPDATVVYVMNHRSNMDYVLVTYLAAKRSALSYAVGEWAQVWPLSRLIRAMGAYFIRRRERDSLYHRVLERYVQMATRGGVTQAIFPEGGLSLDGRVGQARLGLLSYIADDLGPDAPDIVFVPVALNYDRVIEDGILVEAAQSGERRFRGSFLTGTAFALRWLWRRMTGKARRFGLAAVRFGEPLSLADYGRPTDRAALVAMGDELMARIRAEVPVLPVPLVAAALAEGAASRDELLARLEDLCARLGDAGARVELRGDIAETLRDALARMKLRHLVEEHGGQVIPDPRKGALLRFYAASVTDLLAPGTGRGAGRGTRPRAAAARNPDAAMQEIPADRSVTGS